MENRIIKIIILFIFTIILTSCKDSDCIISLSCGNIISLKPSSDFTLTANLSGGTAADKNNFKFQLDVYDVVDLLYTNNKAIITPLKEGICTLTVSHPKSTFDRTVIIKVQQFEENNNEKTKFTEITDKKQKSFFVGTDLHYIIMPIGATTFIEAGVFEKTSLFNIEEVDFSADKLTWEADNKDIIKMSNSTGNIIIIEAEKIGKTYINVSYPKCVPGTIYVECMSEEDYKKSSPYLRCDLLYIPENSIYRFNTKND